MGRDQVRDGAAHVEEWIHVQRQRRGVRQAAGVVGINFWIEQAAQTTEAKAHQVAVEIFVVAEIEVQSERLAETPHSKTERGRADAAQRLAFEPWERHVLHERERAEVGQNKSVVVGGVGVEGRRIQREPVAAAQGPAARRAGRRLVVTEAEAAADRAVRLLAMCLRNEPPHLPRRAHGQARRLHRADYATAVNVRAQKRVGLGKLQLMDERRHAVRLSLEEKSFAPEPVHFHLVGEPLLVAQHELLQRRDGMRLRSAVLRHEIRDADEGVAGERADVEEDAVRQRGVGRAVARGEDDGERLRVTDRQHGACGRRVGEGAGDIRAGVQLQRAERAAGKNRRGRGPGEERHGLAADADVEKIRARDGKEVRQVIRRERDDERLRRMRGEHGAGRRRVAEDARNIRGRVQLRATERSALLDGRGRGPRHDRRGASDVDEHDAAGREKIRGIVRRELHEEWLGIGDAQHRPGGRNKLERTGGIHSRVQLRRRERGAVDDGRGVRPGDGRRRRSHGDAHALRGDGEARKIVGREDDGELLRRAGIENRSRRRGVGEGSRRIRIGVQLHRTERRAVIDARRIGPRQRGAARTLPERADDIRRERRMRGRRQRKLIRANVLQCRARVAFHVLRHVSVRARRRAERRTVCGRTPERVREIGCEQRICAQCASVGGDAERGAEEDVALPQNNFRPRRRHAQIDDLARRLAHDVVRDHAINRRQRRRVRRAGERAGQADDERVGAVDEGVEGDRGTLHLEIAVQRTGDQALHQDKRPA